MPEKRTIPLPWVTTHGVGGYRRGCRCEACKTSKSTSDRAHYERNREKIKAATDQYRRAHPEKVYVWQTKWRRANPAVYRDATSRYRERNPEKIKAAETLYRSSPEGQAKARAARRQWYEANREQVIRSAIERTRTETGRLLKLARDHQRRARKKAAGGSANATQIAGRIAMWGGLCYICGALATTLDHVIPLARGGSHWPANLRPCCKSCNSRKGAR